MSVRHLLALGALALVTSPAPAAAADRYVAVKEVSGLGGGGDRAFLAKLSGRVRAAAIQELRGRYQVMMPDNIEEILRRSGKKGQEILAQCSEASCAAQFGQILGADLVVAGMLAELEGTLDLTVEVYDVMTANVLGSDSVRARSKLELVDGAFGLTQRLLRGAVPGSMSAARPAGPAVGAFEETPAASFGVDAEEVVVSFESAPEGAIVRLDGQLLCSQTPCRKRVLAGAHEAIFEKERFSAAARKFTAAKGAAVKATLLPTFGWVSVETAPPGVAIAIDGADAGRSPVAWREADAGTVEVAIADPCWLRAGERVLVTAGERRLVSLQAKPRLAGLKVNAEDEKGNALEADVTVDGAVVGPAGATLRVPACAKKVSVPLGRDTFEAELKLEEGKVATVTARPAPGAVAMARLAGGTYTTASTNRLVTVQPFLLDATEVTVAAYAECAKARKCSAAPATVEWPGIAESDRARWSPQCNEARPDRMNHPVNCVDWTQAAAYCAAVGKRLPTEEEWEWAARGGELARKYPWGDDAPAARACWNGSGNDRKARGFEGTCPVGSHPGGDSPQGVKDLAGNVWEWTSSYEGANHIARGGGWVTDMPDSVAAPKRHQYGATPRGSDMGFRCARTP